eukprot:CFRG3274T1
MSDGNDRGHPQVWDCDEFCPSLEVEAHEVASKLGDFCITTNYDHYYDEDTVECTATVHLAAAQQRVRGLNLILYARVIYYNPSTKKVKTARTIHMLKQLVHEGIVPQVKTINLDYNFVVPMFTPPSFNTRHTVLLSDIPVVVITRVVWTVELVGEVEIEGESFDEYTDSPHHAMVLAFKEINKRTLYQTNCDRMTVEGISTVAVPKIGTRSTSHKLQKSGVRRSSTSTSSPTHTSDHCIEEEIGVPAHVLDVHPNRRNREQFSRVSPEETSNVPPNTRTIHSSNTRSGDGDVGYNETLSMPAATRARAISSTSMVDHIQPENKAQLHFLYESESESTCRTTPNGRTPGVGMEDLEYKLKAILDTDFLMPDTPTKDNHIVMRASVKEAGSLSNTQPFDVEVSVLTNSRVLFARSIEVGLIQTTSYNLNMNYTPSFTTTVVARAKKKLKFKPMGKKTNSVTTYILSLDPAKPKSSVVSNNYSCEGLHGDVPAPTAVVVDTAESTLIVVEYTLRIKCRVWGGNNIVCIIPIVLESCGESRGARALIDDSESMSRASDVLPCTAEEPMTNVPTPPSTLPATTSGTRRMREYPVLTIQVDNSLLRTSPRENSPLRVNSPHHEQLGVHPPRYNQIAKESTKSFGPLSTSSCTSLKVTKTTGKKSLTSLSTLLFRRASETRSSKSSSDLSQDFSFYWKTSPGLHDMRINDETHQPTSPSVRCGSLEVSQRALPDYLDVFKSS